MNNATRASAIAVLAALAMTGSTLAAQPSAKPDATGVLRKPIPDRLVVLTFDDGCASSYTVVAPILKKYGFGGSFYICDFDSFRTRKDWYLTWRQMKALAADGFDVGNHTVGHAGGANIDFFNALEDQAMAHGVPKMTTIAWPVHHVNPKTFPDLAAQGYTFGRSGHNRVYRPTTDNCYDIPSFSANNLEGFAKVVRQAVNGKVVTICFHGVPDGEHPQVGLDPSTFEEMMQYLKENHYKVIALRDLGEYIDSAKAGMLPPTSDKGPFPDAGETVQGDKPPACKDIKSFSFPNLPGASIFQTQITANVPFGTDVTALAPQITVSEGASVEPAAGVARDFTKPQTYTVTASNGAKKVFTVAVHETRASARNNLLTFALPGATMTIPFKNVIHVCVPDNTDVKALAPTFTLPPFAAANPASGTVRNFTRPQTYAITAQDGSTQVYTVSVFKAKDAHVFNWKSAAPGQWSDASKWQAGTGGKAVPNAADGAGTILDFSVDGSFDVANDLKPGLPLNQLRMTIGQGHAMKLTGNGLALTPNRAAGVPPGIHLISIGQKAQCALPLDLTSDVTMNLSRHSELSLDGLLSGDGRLILNCTDPQPEPDNYHYNACTLFLRNRTNTYRGGTVIYSGRIGVFPSEQALGTGPVTVYGSGRLWVMGLREVANPVTAHGGSIEGDASWRAPVTLNGTLRLAGRLSFHETGGGMSGPGGLTMVGTDGPWGWVNDGAVQLWGTNTYTGPTTVVRGTLSLRRSAALYNGDVSQWTPTKIAVRSPATLRVSVGGKGEFTGAQVGTLLKNLTADIDNNGLMGGSFFCIDTANAAEPVTIPSTIADSKGPGGGWFFFKKAGAGAMELSGANTYTGQTFVEDGALIVSSLNRVAGGRPSSSLGAPTDVESGEIVLGQDGDCALIYTGAGETTDRVVNLAGKNSTVTFDQSGSGLLKFTSPFTISGYGAGKTIVLKGGATGRGEIAGNITDPYDRAGKATTAVTKSGAGAWTLSGVNSYTGATTVAAGTLVLAGARSLGPKTDVIVADGAALDLDFQGRMNVRSLSVGGKMQPPGEYGAARFPQVIRGAGVLSVQPSWRQCSGERPQDEQSYLKANRNWEPTL